MIGTLAECMYELGIFAVPPNAECMYELGIYVRNCMPNNKTVSSRSECG
jgi:hypothetical protein